MTDHGASTPSGEEQPLQLLSPDGTLTEDEQYSPYIEGLDDEELRDLYRHMALERRFDQEATSLQRQGQLALWAPALGQEAAQIGTVAALKHTDMIFPTYREHAMALYRGVAAEELMQTFRATAHSGWDPSTYNLQIYTLVLGAQTLHAVGWAMAAVRDAAAGDLPHGKAEDEIVLACLGDGASSQGDVHESMVFAASYGAPVLYFLQNNHWAISVPAATQSKAPLAARAGGYGFESLRVDGNDVLASYAAAAEMAEQIRAGSGPKLIESVTYRIGAHTTADDPTKYRTAEEVESWRAKDPIARYAGWLEQTDRMDADWLASLEQEGDDLAADLRRTVLSMESIDIGEVFDTVYAEPHRQVEAEKMWLKDYEAGFAEEQESGSGGQTGGGR